MRPHDCTLSVGDASEPDRRLGSGLGRFTLEEPWLVHAPSAFNGPARGGDLGSQLEDGPKQTYTQREETVRAGM